MQSALALPRPSDQWIATDLGLYIPSGFWPNVPKALRREIRFGRVEEAFRELKELLGIGAKAITENGLAGGTASERSQVDSTTYASTVTCTAGSVQIASIVANQAFGSASVPTVSGWTQIGSVTGTTYTTTAFWAQLSGSQTVTFTFGTIRQSAIWSIQEFANCDPTTPINANVITGGATSTTPGGTLPNAFANSNSGVFAVSSTNADTVAYAAGSGYSLIYDQGNSESFNTMRHASEWRNNNNSTPSFTLGSSQIWAFVACELVGIANKSESFRTPAVRVAQQLISHWRRQ